MNNSYVDNIWNESLQDGKKLERDCMGDTKMSTNIKKIYECFPRWKFYTSEHTRLKKCPIRVYGAAISHEGDNYIHIAALTDVDELMFGYIKTKYIREADPFWDDEDIITRIGQSNTYTMSIFLTHSGWIQIPNIADELNATLYIFD